jgi:uncharacterized protein (TIGR04255 family)
MVASSTSRAADHDLVSYASPPVEEVALALQFKAQVVDLEVFATFTTAVRDRLPKRDYKPPLPPMEELFDLRRAAPNFSMTFDPSFALPRIWFISSDDVWLVQLQADRLTVNWRRPEAGGEYPRYVEVRRRLVEFLDVLVACLAERGIAEPGINFCEVTYVNSIPVEEDAAKQGRHHTAGFLLRDVQPWREERFLPPPEDMQAQVRWRIADDGGKPLGRLYLSVTPALRPLDMMPIYMMNLTSRVLPHGEDRESALQALDLGHRWAVLAFDELTTPEMHEIWGKRGVI